jgi:hypothetical protein
VFSIFKSKLGGRTHFLRLFKNIMTPPDSIHLRFLNNPGDSLYKTVMANSEMPKAINIIVNISCDFSGSVLHIDYKFRFLVFLSPAESEI